jgi:hypothetical protein
MVSLSVRRMVYYFMCQRYAVQHTDIVIRSLFMTTPLARHLPALAAVLGEKPTTLYERQRELIREGLLHAVQGRGRGSGVQATPEAVAMLLVGRLASIGLAGAGPRTRGIAEAVLLPPPPVPDRPPYVPADGARFVDVLVSVLTDEALAALVYAIEVDTAYCYAVISFPKTLPIVFTDRNKTESVPPIRTRNSISGDTLRALAAAVKDITASNKGEDSHAE